MDASAMDFKSFQDKFQRTLLGEETDILDGITDSSKETRDVLLGVYQNAYVLRLIEFLKNDFEKVNVYLGDEGFEAAARAYVVAHPSDNPNARWFGRHFPAFISETEPYAGNPEIGELARFEYALLTSFDAPDAPPVSMDDLTQIAPEDWPRLQFEPHPSVLRADFSTNAVDIWKAFSQNHEATPPDARTLEQPEQIIVYRDCLQPKFRNLSHEEAMMWDEAAKGAPFGTLCEMVAAYGGEEEAALRAAAYLKGWVESGLLT